MRQLLQKTALLLFAASILIWVIGGANRGFYKNRLVIEKEEAITGIVERIERPKFIPGIETPAIGIFIGGSFFLFSFLFKKPLTSSN